jgi:plastocyanin
MMRLGLVGVLLGASALAAPVKGVVRLPDEPRPPESGGYWRVENGLLPVLPSADRGEALVVLEPLSPSKAEPSHDPAPITVELHGLRMDPRVLAVPVGAVVHFKNSDRVPHTLYVEHGASMMPPEPTPAGQTRTQKFLAAGAYQVRDQEYPHVQGVVLAGASAWSAMPDAGGAFKLEAPEGKYTARVWWRGAWVLSQPVTVGHNPVDLNLVVPVKK